MQTYYLILREDLQAFDKISPSEMQAVVQRYVKWREDNSKFVTGGQKLTDGQGLAGRATSARRCAGW